MIYRYIAIDSFDNVSFYYDIAISALKISITLFTADNNHMYAQYSRDNIMYKNWTIIKICKNEENNGSGF